MAPKSSAFYRIVDNIAFRKFDTEPDGPIYYVGNKQTAREDWKRAMVAALCRELENV